MPDFSVLHCLSEFAQVRGHQVGDAMQPSHPLPPPSLFAFSLSQHQGLFHGVDSGIIANINWSLPSAPGTKLLKPLSFPQ